VARKKLNGRTTDAFMQRVAERQHPNTLLLPVRQTFFRYCCYNYTSQSEQIITLITLVAPTFIITPAAL